MSLRWGSKQSSQGETLQGMATPAIKQMGVYIPTQRVRKHFEK